MRRLILLLLVLGLFAIPRVTYADSPVHIVAYGETLYSIARQYGVTPQALADANGITTSSWVYAGQRLRIPIAGNSNTTAPAQASAPARVSADVTPSGIYTVKAGDTLSSLARAFGISVAALADANDIPPNGFLYTGWQLKIPGGGGNAGASVPYTGVPAQPANRPTNLTTTYIVQPGDTLFGIAVKNNLTIATLRIANNLSNLFVYSGQRLIIPNGTSASTLTTSASTQTSSASTQTSSGSTQTTSTTQASNIPANNSVAPGLAVQVDNIPTYRQAQTLTCEEAAAAMALRGALTEDQIVAAMPRSDNPFEGIRGSTNFDLIGGLTHYGTYAQGLEKGLAALGHPSTPYYGQPYETFKASIIETLKEGRPVLWWTTWHESQQRPQWVEVSNGLKVPLTPYEHTVVIVAANDQGVTYHDPYDGTVRFTTWANHQRASGYFNNMALVVY